jgi:hypothetical protein
MIRPSSLPMLDQCPCFESGTSSEYAEAGTARDTALTALLQGNAEPLATLSDEDADAVRWAADQIKLRAPMSDYPLEAKPRVNPLGSDFLPYFENGGEPDFICGPMVIDLKSRERDYTAQLAAYAIDRFEAGFEEVTVLLLFASLQRWDTYKLDEQSARAKVEKIIAKAKAPDKQPSPCDYCHWCAKQLTCKPHIDTAKRVAAGYADAAHQALVTSWHPSEMSDPAQIALGLSVARRILKPWIESMEFHAREAVLKKGVSLPGYELKERKGKSYVADVAQAHQLLGVEAAQFLQCCDLRMNTSKTYPDKRGVIDVFATVKEIPKAAAKRQVNQLLEPVIKTSQPTVSLVAVGDAAEPSQE